LNRVVSTVYNTTVYLKYPLQNNYTSNAQIVSSGKWGNVNLSGTVVPLTSWVSGAGGIFFLICNGLLTINGTINVNGNNGTSTQTTGGGAVGVGFVGGHGRKLDSAVQSYCGEGYSGGMALQYTAQGNGGGGGWSHTSGGTRTSGGGGGNATAGGEGGHGSQDIGGYGGGTSGNASLTNMVFGGGGGGGANGDQNLTVWTGAGGAGGGIVFLLAKKLDVNGSITANGGNGSTGTNGGCGGGGGAGGCVLIKSEECDLGTNVITASAGSGADNGGNGGIGRMHYDYRASISGSTNNPVADGRQDLTLKNPTNAFLFNML
jgi:hypothetical protein